MATDGGARRCSQDGFSAALRENADIAPHLARRVGAHSIPAVCPVRRAQQLPRLTATGADSHYRQTGPWGRAPTTGPQDRVRKRAFCTDREWCELRKSVAFAVLKNTEPCASATPSRARSKAPTRFDPVSRRNTLDNRPAARLKASALASCQDARSASSTVDQAERGSDPSPHRSRTGTPSSRTSPRLAPRLRTGAAPKAARAVRLCESRSVAAAQRTAPPALGTTGERGRRDGERG